MAKKNDSNIAGEEKSLAERLLAIMLFPFRLAFKIMLKIFKIFVRSIILAPFTIIIWLGAIVALFLIFFK